MPLYRVDGGRGETITVILIAFPFPLPLRISISLLSCLILPPSFQLWDGWMNASFGCTFWPPLAAISFVRTTSARTVDERECEMGRQRYRAIIWPMCFHYTITLLKCAKIGKVWDVKEYFPILDTQTFADDDFALSVEGGAGKDSD